MLQLPPNRASVEGEGNQGPVLKLRVPTPSTVSSLTSVPNDIPESVNRKLSLIDEHPSSQCTLVTPIRTTSSAVTEVDVPADVPGMEVDSAVPGTEDTELETDSPSSELSGTDEPSDSDSMVENDLDQLCTAKSTEFKMRNNIPGFD